MPLRAFFLRVWTRLDVTIGAPGPWSAVEGWVLHPKLYDSPITAARARLMLGCCMIMGLAAPLTFYWAWHAPANATSYLIVGLVQLLTCSTFLLLRWNSTMGLPSTAVMVSTTALVLAATSLTGGLQSVWVLGYPMVTIFVGLLGGYRKTIAAALILSCGATIIYAVDSLGLADLGAPPPPSLMLLNLIGAVIIGVVMAVYATYQSDLLLERAGAALERTRLAQEEAERANRAQEMFMAYLSHEIGNPLAVIMGAVDLMGLPGTEDRQQRYIDAMKSASQGLSGLLKDVLDFRALARGRLQVRKDVVALAELLQEMVDLHSLAADEKELQFHFDHGSETNVWADWSRLRQVMSNLLDNAVKYTSSGFVRVTMETQGDRVRVAVTDSGPGIDPKNREQIFQPFERAQAGDDPGSGLGLAVSRGLVRLMGSELLFEAPEAGGSTFHFTLAIARAPIDTKTPDALNRSVLVVDDNKAAASLLAEMAEHLGCQVRISHEGLHALETMAECLPDVVLLDVDMPGMKGRDVALAIVECWGADAPAVWFVTGSPILEPQESRALGVLTKPVNLEQLREAVLS